MLTPGQLAPCIIRRSFFLHARSRSITFSLQSVHRFQHTQRQRPALRENIYTTPNLLTLSRIAACPALGWAILSDNYAAATGLLLYAGITDWVSTPRQLSTSYSHDVLCPSLMVSWPASTTRHRFSEPSSILPQIKHLLEHLSSH
jgi:hypothetical protein